MAIVQGSPKNQETCKKQDHPENTANRQAIMQAVIGLIVRDQRIFICQRQGHQSLSGYWEFPGGKIERGESIYQALVREMREETGIHCRCAYPWALIPGRKISLSIWWITRYDGYPCGAEGQAYQWHALRTLQKQKFPAANALVIDLLQRC